MSFRLNCVQYQYIKNRQWRLKNKKAQPTAAPEISPPSKNIWVLLRKTQEKIARMGEVSSKSLVLVELYNQARTYFERNC